jgi:peptide/nickel transport system substrate-binding protein
MKEQIEKLVSTRRGFLIEAAVFGAVTAGGLAGCSTSPNGSGGGSSGPPGVDPNGPAGLKEVSPGVPRNQCLILENPTGRVNPPDDFNRWRPGETADSTGLQQICLDALWYIDPDKGVNGVVWDNACAAEKPIYNQDFTQMTVKLRQGLMWSDGVEFTAEDLYYTVDVQMKNDGWNYTGQFRTHVKSMEMPDKYTVVFNLNAPNSRFHAYFTVRWAACWMMPKHVFEKQPDPKAYKFNPPVSLSAYTLKSFDPNGNWYLWEKRPDWQKTSMALIGEPGPKWAMYIAPGPSDKRVMAQTQHELDVIHDITPEGRITLAKQLPTTSVGWFPSFPWAHPDPTLPAIIFNNEKPGLDKQEVRWALTLAIDIVRVSMASYRGAATMSPIHVPPTGMYPQYYHDPLEPWLRDFTLDLGNGETYKPYDDQATYRIADEARKSLGDLVPTDKTEIRKALGMGWWKYDVKAAEKLMIKAGMKKVDGKWALPDGSAWKVPLMSMGESNPTMNRLASMVVECWKEFGVDTTQDVRDNPWELMGLGDYMANVAWTIETWGGHPDLFYFLSSWHSKLYQPTGKRTAGSNHMRWKDPELDRIIDAIQQLGFDDPKVVELGKDFIKLAATKMPITPVMSYNVFTVCDTTYFDGYPTSKNPYTDPVPNWGNTKYMYTQVKPKVKG